MARTAPFPNVPAIPGMNPGIWIMGGGGAFGGANGKGGKGNAPGQGAGGNNGGNDPHGGGKNAAKCGPGSGSGCPNPAHGGAGTHAGDPVDPISGRVFTIAQADLVLTGVFALSIDRAYSSSAADRDLGLGFGWSHSLAWEIETRRRTLVVRRPNGTTVLRDLIAVGESCQIADGAKLSRDRGGFVITEGSRLFVFSASELSPSRWLLSSVSDWSGNRVALGYEKDLLATLTDTVGRTTRVQRFPDGHIRAFELEGRGGRRMICRSYAYDEQGDLVATVDAAGRRVGFTYEEHRLTRVAYPSGLTTHYRYDAEQRCVETWCDYLGGVDPSLADDVPALLADGLTKARGVLHVRLEYGPDFTMVYDSRKGKRFDHGPGGKVAAASSVWTEKLEYDDRGNVTAYQRPTGGTTRFDRDGEGRLVAQTDSAGASTRYEYDGTGNLIEAIDALGASVTYSHGDAHELREVRDALGLLLSFAHDDRGRRTVATLPDGSETRFEYDAEGNLAKLREPNGKARTFEHDEMGRVISFRDEEGGETVFHYDPVGVLLGATLPNGTRSTIELDADGRMARYIGGDGGVYAFSWSGYNVVHELRKPGGDVLRFRYDRECNLVEVVNEAGELYRCERDLAGRVVGETYFDGRRHGYGLDEDGQINRITNALGEAVILERDDSGRLARRSFADDSFEAFEYDAVGRLVAASTKETRCEYTYDLRGNLALETQVCRGERAVIASTYDARGRRVTMTTQAGYAISVDRDRMGLPSVIRLGDGAQIGLTHDGLGREIHRSLGASCDVLTRYDAVGNVLERRIVKPFVAAANAPAWTGKLAPGTILEEGFAYGPGGALVEQVDSTGARTTFTYDALGRVTERLRKTGATEEREQLEYGRGGRLREAGEGAPQRAFGLGGVVVAHGDRDFEIDAEGRRVRLVQRATGAAGVLDWSARNSLDRQLLPDGTQIDHLYDAHARRLVKRVLRPDGALTETRFVWSGDQLIQETETRWGNGAVLGTRRVDYVYRDDGMAPLAQRETRGAGEPGPWTHYLLGAGHAPSLLVSAEGDILARAAISVFGDVHFDASSRARSPWGYAGMYRDDESGLCYQRYRFYDPSVGQYLSPDPLGVGASLNAWEYAHGQPLRVIDPLGLTDCVILGTAGANGTMSESRGKSGGAPTIHPVIAAAIPPRHPDTVAGIYPTGDQRSPTTCAEPRALSAHLTEWEKNHNGRQQLDPSNPDDHPKIQRALASIGSIQATDKGAARSPCPNCSQLIANLHNRYGAPNPNAPNSHHPGQPLVLPGATAKNGTDSENFMQPHPDWAAQQRANPQRSGMPPFGPADPEQNPPKTGPAFPPRTSYDRVDGEGG